VSPGFAGLDISEWPHVKAWHDRLLERRAVQVGIDIPSKVDGEMLKDPKEFKKFIAPHAQWIKQLMEENAKA
jgi:glutathione S-transferase